MEMKGKFKSRTMSDNQKGKSVLVRRKFSELANLINRMVEDSREKSIVMTKLEEACMWCNVCIANETKEDLTPDVPMGEPFNSKGDI